MKILKIRSMMSILNLKTTVTQQAWILTDNLNIDGSCLNGGKLHLNRKRIAALAKNLCRSVRSLPLD